MSSNNPFLAARKSSSVSAWDRLQSMASSSSNQSSPQATSNSSGPSPVTSVSPMRPQKDHPKPEEPKSNHKQSATASTSDTIAFSNKSGVNEIANSAGHLGDRLDKQVSQKCRSPFVKKLLNVESIQGHLRKLEKAAGFAHQCLGCIDLKTVWKNVCSCSNGHLNNEMMFRLELGFDFYHSTDLKDLPDSTKEKFLNVETVYNHFISNKNCGPLVKRIKSEFQFTTVSVVYAFITMGIMFKDNSQLPSFEELSQKILVFFMNDKLNFLQFLKKFLHLHSTLSMEQKKVIFKTLFKVPPMKSVKQDLQSQIKNSIVELVKLNQELKLNIEGQKELSEWAIKQCTMALDSKKLKNSLFTLKAKAVVQSILKGEKTELQMQKYGSWAILLNYFQGERVNAIAVLQELQHIQSIEQQGWLKLLEKKAKDMSRYFCIQYRQQRLNNQNLLNLWMNFAILMECLLKVNSTRVAEQLLPIVVNSTYYEDETPTLIVANLLNSFIDSADPRNNLAFCLLSLYFGSDSKLGTKISEERVCLIIKGYLNQNSDRLKEISDFYEMAEKVGIFKKYQRQVNIRRVDSTVIVDSLGKMIQSLNSYSQLKSVSLQLDLSKRFNLNTDDFAAVQEKKQEEMCLKRIGLIFQKISVFMHHNAEQRSVKGHELNFLSQLRQCSRNCFSIVISKMLERKISSMKKDFSDFSGDSYAEDQFLTDCIRQIDSLSSISLKKCVKRSLEKTFSEMDFHLHQQQSADRSSQILQLSDSIWKYSDEMISCLNGKMTLSTVSSVPPKLNALWKIRSTVDLSQIIKSIQRLFSRKTFMQTDVFLEVGSRLFKAVKQLVYWCSPSRIFDENFRQCLEKTRQIVSCKDLLQNAIQRVFNEEPPQNKMKQRLNDQSEKFMKQFFDMVDQKMLFGVQLVETESLALDSVRRFISSKVESKRDINDMSDLIEIHTAQWIVSMKNLDPNIKLNILEYLLKASREKLMNIKSYKVVNFECKRLAAGIQSLIMNFLKNSCCAASWKSADEKLKYSVEVKLTAVRILSLINQLLRVKINCFTQLAFNLIQSEIFLENLKELLASQSDPCHLPTLLKIKLSQKVSQLRTLNKTTHVELMPVLKVSNEALERELEIGQCHEEFVKAIPIVKENQINFHEFLVCLVQFTYLAPLHKVKYCSNIKKLEVFKYIFDGLNGTPLWLYKEIVHKASEELYEGCDTRFKEDFFFSYFLAFNKFSQSLNEQIDSTTELSLLEKLLPTYKTFMKGSLTLVSYEKELRGHRTTLHRAFDLVSQNIQIGYILLKKNQNKIEKVEIKNAYQEVLREMYEFSLEISDLAEEKYKQSSSSTYNELKKISIVCLKHIQMCQRQQICVNKFTEAQSAKLKQVNQQKQYLSETFSSVDAAYRKRIAENKIYFGHRKKVSSQHQSRQNFHHEAFMFLEVMTNLPKVQVTAFPNQDSDSFRSELKNYQSNLRLIQNFGEFLAINNKHCLNFDNVFKPDKDSVSVYHITSMFESIIKGLSLIEEALDHVPQIHVDYCQQCRQYQKSYGVEMPVTEYEQIVLNNINFQVAVLELFKNLFQMMLSRKRPIGEQVTKKQSIDNPFRNLTSIILSQIFKSQCFKIMSHPERNLKKQAVLETDGQAEFNKFVAIRNIEKRTYLVALFTFISTTINCGQFSHSHFEQSISEIPDYSKYIRKDIKTSFENFFQQLFIRSRHLLSEFSQPLTEFEKSLAHKKQTVKHADERICDGRHSRISRFRINELFLTIEYTKKLIYLQCQLRMVSCSRQCGEGIQAQKYLVFERFLSMTQFISKNLLRETNSQDLGHLTMRSTRRSGTTYQQVKKQEHLKEIQASFSAWVRDWLALMTKHNFIKSSLYLVLTGIIIENASRDCFAVINLLESYLDDCSKKGEFFSGLQRLKEELRRNFEAIIF